MKSMFVLHYLILVLILGGGVAAFFYAAPNTLMQFTVAFVTSAAYVLWGAIYHLMKKDLHLKVMVEYVLVGAIAVVLLATVLWN